MVVTVCAARATLGAAADECQTGEQTLTRRIVTDQPWVFTAGRCFLFDRKLLGTTLVEQILDAGVGGRLPLAMERAWLDADRDTPPARTVSFTATLREVLRNVTQTCDPIKERVARTLRAQRIQLDRHRHRPRVTDPGSASSARTSRHAW